MTRFQINPNMKHTLTRAGLVLVGLIFVFGMFRVIRGGSSSASQTPANDKVQGANTIALPDALASQAINREFQFPLTDNTGEEVSKIKYLIESAEIRDEIIVKGQQATAIQGRAFLIIHIKISNDFNQGIEINTRDYLRLGLNNSGEWLAADIHNDPTEVQAISTKRTRLGFPISTTDSDFVIQVGEINGEKRRMPLDLSIN